VGAIIGLLWKGGVGGGPEGGGDLKRDCISTLGTVIFSGGKKLSYETYTNSRDSLSSERTLCIGTPSFSHQ